MRPEIEDYLRQHGAKYTPEALRKQLIDAGHDPAEVDEALPTRASLRSARQAFDRWALWLHIGAFVAPLALVVLLNGSQAVGVAIFAAVTLGLFLALGWAASSLLGRVLLRRTSLPIALIFPAISALGLGGTCLAILGGLQGVSS